jgi:predicted trehalose synthase
VNGRNQELLDFYQRHRIEDQVTFYRRRRDLFDRATGQALAVSATLLGFSSAVSALAGVGDGWSTLWATLATVLPAVSTALAAFTALYAFEQQSKIYGDAIRAVHAASRQNREGEAGGDLPSEESVAGLVQRVEGALRQEQAQWGQLTTQIQIVDQTKE